MSRNVFNLHTPTVPRAVITRWESRQVRNLSANTFKRGKLNGNIIWYINALSWCHSVVLYRPQRPKCPSQFLSLSRDGRAKPIPRRRRIASARVKKSSAKSPSQWLLSRHSRHADFLSRVNLTHRKRTVSFSPWSWWKEWLGGPGPISSLLDLASKTGTWTRASHNVMLCY